MMQLKTNVSKNKHSKVVVNGKDIISGSLLNTTSPNWNWQYAYLNSALRRAVHHGQSVLVGPG